MCIHSSTTIGRYSGFLKRPEILETVYSVEEKEGEEGEKVKEKENEAEVEKEKIENGIKAEEEEEKNSDEKVPRRESETTE